MTKENREPSLFQALIPILFLIIFLAINVFVFGDASLEGSNQMVLILSGAVAALVAWRLGYSWLDIQTGITTSIHSAMPSLLILLIIGCVSGSWLISGVVPAMIYYGLQLLNPTIFLFAACMVCSIVSMATGSSWTTSATVGIALIGIGQTLGIHEGMVAGAIISGAYFGDKMSPLSDTTNLAPAMAGTDLFTHIRYMTITTVPAMSITLLAFLALGFWGDHSGREVATDEVLQAISSKFDINAWLLIVPAVVVFLIIKKVSALPALLAGSLLALVFAFIFQPNIILEVAQVEGGFWKQIFVGMMKSLYGSVGVSTSNEMVNELLSSGGMAGMLNTFWLVISAMVFGGIMEGTGLLKRVVQEIMKWVHSTGSLIASTAMTSCFFNVAASDQYLAIVIPGRMYSTIFKEKGLAPENLSRTLEDSGTVTSVLVPWNTCGAYHAGVLGVSTGTYLPYCFFNMISPMMTIIFGYLNYKIKYLTNEKAKMED